MRVQGLAGRRILADEQELAVHGSLVVLHEKALRERVLMGDPVVQLEELVDRDAVQRIRVCDGTRDRNLIEARLAKLPSQASSEVK